MRQATTSRPTSGITGGGVIRRLVAKPSAVIGLTIIIVVVAMGAVAPAIYSVDPLRIVAPPEIWPFENWAYPLGTDGLGRDIAAIIFHGARTTLIIGLVAAAVATLIGVTIGSLAGYHGGLVDDILMRVTEIFQTLPNLVFLLAVVAVFGPTLTFVVLGIGLITWPSIARLVRAEFMTLRQRDFVQAGKGLGMGDARIIFSEILPNALPPVVVFGSVIVAGAVLFESALSFLGLSDPELGTWGRLIGEGRSYVRTAWYISAVPGIAIVLTVLSLNLIGDALNDILNPRLRK